MDGAIFLNYSGILYTLLLIVSFFTKKRLKSREQTIYSYLIIVSFLELILGLFATFSISSNQSILLMNVSTKLFFISIIMWIHICTYYSIIISTLKNSKKLTDLLKIMLLLSICAILVLNLNFNYIDGKISSTGPSVYSMVVSTTLYIMICIYAYIKSLVNTKNISKKFIPLSIFLTLGTLCMIIQTLNPEMFLIVPLEVFVTSIMYNTIENPDLQMLREFHKARELAEESNKEKTEFLFNISNQIKTPINKIIETSEKVLNENDVIEIKNDVRTIKGKSNSLLNLVNNVLDISDEEMRQIEIRGSKYNVKRLFEIINKKYEKITKVEYRFKYDNSIPEYLYGDSMRIRQIMNILLENAVEYTNVGYIETSVNCIIKNNICRLVITVEDSGIGMETEEIKHLFDKEKIYENELLKEIDDTKNNLSMLKSIVNLMNGNVLVESNIGVGSKFTIIIDQKIIEEKTKIIKTVEEYEEMYEQNKKIIIVTDREEISKKIKKILKKESYEIEEVTLGQTCLERMRKGIEYDLIIIDEEIPKLSSEDTLNKIKDTKCYKKPVILITKNKGFGSREMYQEKGFKDIIIEPIKKEEVINIVKEYIDK